MASRSTDRGASTGERLASIEATFAAHAENDRASFLMVTNALTEIKVVLDTRGTQLAEIQHKLDKQKGFVGGMIFIVSAVWAVIALFAKFKFGV